MNLTEHFERVVDDAEGPDLGHLARVARAQGTRARRRRAVAVLGAAVLVGGVVVGTATLAARGPEPDSRPQVADVATPSPTAVATPTAAPTLDPSETGRFTGRGVVAALRYSLEQVTEGRADSFAGQHSDEAYGELRWHDADGLGVSVVGVNVQPGLVYASPCSPAMLHCTRTRSADGAVLTTYEEHTPVPGGVGVRRTAALLRADDTRVLVSETNGFDLPSNRWDVTRPQPPLTFAELTTVVEQPWWGAELPTYFLDQGRRLAPYEDLGLPWPSATRAPR